MVIEDMQQSLELLEKLKKKELRESYKNIEFMEE